MELTLGSAEYSTRKLSAIQQFHVARRLAPLLWALGEGLVQALSSGKSEISVDGVDANGLFALKNVADMVAQMSDADSEYVLNTCLSVVRRKQSGGWANIQASGGGLMFDDIDLQTMMQLAVTVIKENLGNFFDALPGVSTLPS